MLLKSRASPDMLPFSLCDNKRLAIRHMNRPLFPTTLSIPSYDIGKQVGLRTCCNCLHSLLAEGCNIPISNCHIYTFRKTSEARREESIERGGVEKPCIYRAHIGNILKQESEGSQALPARPTRKSSLARRKFFQIFTRRPVLKCVIKQFLADMKHCIFIKNSSL